MMETTSGHNYSSDNKSCANKSIENIKLSILNVLSFFDYSRYKEILSSDVTVLKIYLLICSSGPV